MSEIKLKDWKDISLSKFYQIQALLEEVDEYTTFNILDVIYDIDSSNMTLQEFAKYNNALNFLKVEVPKVDLKDQYEINGTVYNSNFNLSMVTAAQFIDYQNYIKDNKFEDYLSVFFIPEGHTYNNGYSIAKVKEDLLTLDFATVNSLAFFFTVQFAAFSHHFLLYLKEDLKKMEMTKEKRAEIMDKIDKVDLLSLASFLSY